MYIYIYIWVGIYKSFTCAWRRHSMIGIKNMVYIVFLFSSVFCLRFLCLFIILLKFLSSSFFLFLFFIKSDHMHVLCIYI